MLAGEVAQGRRFRIDNLLLSKHRCAGNRAKAQRAKAQGTRPRASTIATGIWCDSDRKYIVCGMESVTIPTGMCCM